MGKAAKLLVGLIVVAVIAAGVLLIIGQKDNNTPPQGTSDSPKTTAKQMVTITYTNDGFSPKTTAVKAGGTVKVINNSDQDLEFDSNPHPTHTENPEFNLGAVPMHETKTFTVTTKGTWGFHNHLDASKLGEITVE